MAVRHGSFGSIYIKIAPTTYMKFADTSAWTLNVINELAEARLHEERNVRRYPGMRDWNVSLEALVNATRTNNPLITKMVGATSTADLSGATAFVRLRLDTATTPFFQGEGVFVDISVNTPADGLPTLTANLAGNGAIIFAIV